MYSSYRRKKFKSSFMNKLHEKYIRLSKKLKVYVKKILDKGHQHLTIMFIPHSEKKIFNFQISNFTISFFAVILVTIVIFSIISLNTHETDQKQLSQLSKQSKTREGQIVVFKQSSFMTIKNFHRFRKQIVRLSRNIGSDNNDIVFPFVGKGGIDYKITLGMKKKFGKHFNLPSEIKELNVLNNDVIRSTEQIKRINSFVENYKKVMAATPSSWPVAGGGFITSKYGYRPSPFTGIPSLHTGVDIAYWAGSPIKSTAEGIVSFVGMAGGYGLIVRIKHKYGFSTMYGHLQSANVKVGDNVRKGQVVAYMGNSGRSTGYHVHYEVHLGNLPIDPMPYLAVRIF